MMLGKMKAETISFRIRQERSDIGHVEELDSSVTGRKPNCKSLLVNCDASFRI